jgi:hypothetical protein
MLELAILLRRKAFTQTMDNSVSVGSTKNKRTDLASIQLSSISTLPTEILEKVFIESTGPDGCNPRQPAQVCRLWYQIAINSPSLWTEIDILSYREDGLFDRSAPPREMCTSLIELEQTLSRAKRATLNIRVDCVDWDEQDYDIPSRAQFIQRLFSPETTPQIAYLDISYKGLRIPKGIVNWPYCSFPLLRELHGHTWFLDADEFLKAVDASVHNLKTIGFASDVPNVVLKNMWSKLTRIYLGDVTGVVADAALAHCQSVEMLSLGGDWPTATTPPINFPELQQLSLSCSNLACMASLQLPRLITLTLSQKLHRRHNVPHISIQQVSNVAFDLP